MCLLNKPSARPGSQVPTPRSAHVMMKKGLGLNHRRVFPTGVTTSLTIRYCWVAFEAIPALVQLPNHAKSRVRFSCDSRHARVTVNQHSECKDATELVVAPHTPPQLKHANSRVICGPHAIRASLPATPLELNRRTTTAWASFLRRSPNTW